VPKLSEQCEEVIVTAGHRLGIHVYAVEAAFQDELVAEGQDFLACDRIAYVNMSRVAEELWLGQRQSDPGLYVEFWLHLLERLGELGSVSIGWAELAIGFQVTDKDEHVAYLSLLQVTGQGSNFSALMRLFDPLHTQPRSIGSAVEVCARKVRGWPDDASSPKGDQAEHNYCCPNVPGFQPQRITFRKTGSGPTVRPT